MNNSDILFFIVQQTMFFSVPLLIVALGGLFCERSGVVNIAMEGIMIIGAFVSVSFIEVMQTFTSLDGNLLLLLASLAAAAAGLLFSLLHAYASVTLLADQVISGTALNIAAPAIAVFFGRRLTGAITGHSVAQIQFTNSFHIRSVPILGDIPIIGRLLFQNCYITTYLGFLILIISAIVLYKTRFGLRLRACGENPQAAGSVGIGVERIRYAGVMISGALGGLGGLVFVIPTSTNFNGENGVSGYGFLAVAVLIFGQWKPARVLLASLFFGVMKALAASYSSVFFLRDLPVPQEIYKMIPYVATLAVLIFSSKSSQAPKASGIPYDPGA